MPDGFIGPAAQSYLEEVEEALSEARAEHNISGEDLETSIENQVTPIPPDEATRGSYATGVGNSSNVVVDHQAYEDFLRQLTTTDNNIMEVFGQIATQIEDICQTSYRVPQTGPRCVSVANMARNSLNDFRSLTDETSRKVRAFVDDITSIR